MSLKSKKLHRERKRAEYDRRRLAKLGAAGKWRPARKGKSPAIDLERLQSPPTMVDVLVAKAKNAMQTGKRFFRGRRGRG